MLKNQKDKAFAFIYVRWRPFAEDMLLDNIRGDRSGFTPTKSRHHKLQSAHFK